MEELGFGGARGGGDDDVGFFVAGVLEGDGGLGGAFGDDGFGESDVVLGVVLDVYHG